MKILMLIAALVAAQTVFAKEVEVNCVAKAYACDTGSCGWYAASSPNPDTVTLLRDPNYPKDGAPYEIWRATYRAAYDRHQLTLNLEVKDYGTSQPVTVFAKLDAGSVIAESTSLNSADIGLRNQNYGRGFTCTSIRAID